VEWCTTYLTPRYTHRIGPARTEHVFLDGRDCYALRCAVLHEGVDDVSGQRAKKALDSFLFVVPPTDGLLHCNQSDSKLQLQVDIFCRDICAGVDEWLAAVPPAVPEVAERMRSLMVVHSLEGGIAF
jgi:hypothetical protein